MSIPIAIIIFALRKRKINTIRLFLYLKYTGSGHLKWNNSLLEKTCADLNWKSEKTFKKHLNWLIRKRWISINSKTKSLRVKSYQQIILKIKFSTATTVLAEQNVLNNFRPFCYAAAITWAMRYKHHKERQSGCKKGRSRKSCHLRRMYQIPNQYLAAMLQLNYTTISKYRTAAAKAGYIKVTHYFQAIGLPAKFLGLLKQAYPENRHRLVLVHNQVHWQLPSYITSTIHLSTSRKIRLLLRSKHPT